MSSFRRSWSPGENFFRGIPVTKIIILIWVGVFLANVLRVPLVALLAFSPVTPFWLTGLFTYPLAFTGDIIGLLLNGYVFYMFGGSLERGWGARNFLLFLLGVSLAAILLWEIGVLLVIGRLVQLATTWLLISAIIVAWAWQNPEEQILLFFVLPIKAKWVGWLDIILTFFLFPTSVVGGGPERLMLGFFSLGGIAAAIGYVWYQHRWGWIPRRPKAAPSRRVIRHPAASPFAFLLRPFREWQRRRRIAYLQRAFRLDEPENRHND
ncbi:MAG: hypothetical protein ACYC7E_12365 [Armatimonadota bacterium]